MRSDPRGGTGSELELGPGAAVRRSTTFLLRFQEGRALDVAGLLRGHLVVVPEERLVAMSMLTGKEETLAPSDLRALQVVPADRWVPADGLVASGAATGGVLRSLVERGLLIGNAPAGPVAALRDKEQRLLERAWDPSAAFYHMASRTRDEDAAAPVRGAAEATGRPPLAYGPPGVETPAVGVSPGAPAPSADPPAEAEGLPSRLVALQAQALAATSRRFGPAPPPFHRVAGAVARVELPVPHRQDGVFDVLMRRKTTRLFDDTNPITADELSTVLYYTYGCHGYAELVSGVVGLRKTSPSGGGLHPIEAYPLVLNVEGLKTGLYHYNVENHALDLLRPLERSVAQDLVERFTLGQTYFRSSQAAIVLTARWYRQFWKYRHARKSYRVITADAGHLSQTLYLVCTQLGLGAFYTGAINDGNIEEVLGLEPLEEGVIGISGCGRPASRGPTFSLQTLPFVPRQTRL